MKEKDWTWYIRAQESIAQNALTNSKRAECFVKGVYQTHASEGTGARIRDVQGHTLFDFICGLGSTLLGHGNHVIANSVYSSFLSGATLSMSSTSEVVLAEKIKEIIPFIERVRFLKTGTEACMAALRIARAQSGRNLILSDGYHGWSDSFVRITPPAVGVELSALQMTRRLLHLDEVTQEVAAVIVEPIITDHSDLRIAYLRKLRELCTKNGVLLIFDEVITGFRYPKWCASNYYGIEPDLICLGKAMGGGLPLSCVAGRASVMNHKGKDGAEYFVSSTFAGERCSIAASLSLISLLQEKKTYNIDELWLKGQDFQDEFNKLFLDLKIVGYPTRGSFEGSLSTKALLWQEAYKAGVLLGPSFFLSFAHLPYLDRILNILTDVANKIKTGSVSLEGEMPKAAISQKIREVKNEH